MSEQRFTTSDPTQFSDLNDLQAVIEELEEKIGEQQATISTLQDLCGKSDYENAMLRLENKELQKKVDWLCEVFDYGSDESMKVVRQKKEK